jgi:predicted phosphodiesterase
MKRYHFLFTFILFVSLISSSFAAKVAIIGDIHGQSTLFAKSIDQFKEKGISYIIGTGDYGGPAIYQSLQKANITKDHIFLMPGNWEHQVGMEPSDANSEMAKYGTLIPSEKGGIILDEGSGYISIEGKKIRVSHFPQHPISDEYLQSQEYRQRRSSTA